MEDKKTVAEEELKSLFEPNEFVGNFDNVNLSSPTVYSEIPNIETEDQGINTTVVNNNVNLTVDMQKSKTIEKEINNFLKTEQITDPLELKKNYTINLNQNITEQMSNTEGIPKMPEFEASRIADSIQQQISSNPELQTIQNISNETNNNFYNTSNLNIVNEKFYRDIPHIDTSKSPMINFNTIDSIGEMDQKINMLQGMEQQLEERVLEKFNEMSPTQAMRTEPQEIMDEALSNYSQTLENNSAEADAISRKNFSSIPVERSNINKQSVLSSSIDLLVNKMNSPPNWRTVLG